MLLLRGATRRVADFTKTNLVSIHAPLARSNLMRRFATFPFSVSIHAPLARSNGIRSVFLVASEFQYMLLLRGATTIVNTLPFRALFQYMLLLRGATSCDQVTKTQETVSIHAPLARSNRGNINRSGSKCKSKNRAKYQLSFVKEHYCILRFLIIV